MSWWKRTNRDSISPELLQGVRLLDTIQNIFLILVWVTVSVSCLVLLNRFWPSGRRKAHNDVTGWQIAILGTVYAVMIGFMLYAVWANFQTAETNADNEANALMNLYNLADGLPSASRDAIHIAASNYAAAAITQEWPMMHSDRITNAAQPFLAQMWKITIHSETTNSAQLADLQQALLELSNLSKHRRIRLLESRTQMPTILWAVLVLGGIVTVASSCLIGSENFALHFSLIFAISLLISMALVAIVDIDRPFQGAVHVTPSALQKMHITMLIPRSD